MRRKGEAVVVAAAATVAVVAVGLDAAAVEQ
jgi:hypothetical protein